MCTKLPTKKKKKKTEIKPIKKPKLKLKSIKTEIWFE